MSAATATLSAARLWANQRLSAAAAVTDAPTWLAMAGIPTPPTMDGRSILPQLIPESAEHLLAEPTRQQIQRDRADSRPWRKEQFHQ